MSTNFYEAPPSRQLPAEVAEVSLLTIRDVCLAVRMSKAWVHAEVRAGRFPQPLRFGQRCTRWNSSVVRAWLIDRAAQGVAGANSSEPLMAKVAKAAAAAKAKRAAKAAA